MPTAYNPLDLSGKLVLVTGATSGIGRACAITCSRLGARVIISGRRAAALAETRAAMDGQDHVEAPFDLSDTDGIPDWVKRTVAEAGATLDGAVHSAGVGRPTPLRALRRAAVEEIMTPNVYATLALLRGVSVRGVGREGSSVVIISSVAGMVGTPGLVAYSASKGALTAVARSAAQELAAKRIRVNCVAPGYVETPMLDEARANLSGDFAALEQRHYLGFAKPEEVAVGVTYLLSDAARVVTGTTLVIDGGFSS